ncbi:MAG: hypothetical protein AAF617_02620 [Bacteroidota bacterium]
MKKKSIKTLKLHKTVVSKISQQSNGGVNAVSDQYTCTNSEYLCGPRNTDYDGDCPTARTYCGTCELSCQTMLHIC